MAPTKTHLRHTSPKNHLPKKTKNRKKSLRDQLRSVQRLLRQENLPANMRVAQERILNMLEKELRDKAKEDRDKKIAKKYKMVKFFELRKVQRKYNNCKKNLDTCTEDHERICQALPVFRATPATPGTPIPATPGTPTCLTKSPHTCHPHTCHTRYPYPPHQEPPYLPPPYLPHPVPLPASPRAPIPATPSTPIPATPGTPIYFPTEMKYISLFPPTPCNNEEAIKEKDKIFKMINEKVESGEFREAYDMMASPGKDKVQGKKKSPGKLLNLNMSGDDNDQETAKQVLEDDFFIDTKPNVLKDKEDHKPEKSSRHKDTKSKPTPAALSSLENRDHKVKRLKDNREVEASKKIKKDKKHKKTHQNLCF
ncbi:predicted protein [Nematostella vectensis]|uniref:rRNA-processing protein EFG1 n=1 Tax=Nematostella vectensis TaxID=45351 RepID=A7T1E9_NEMVE|nr:predicted protein [Nematostella vectensis]|eukprot:XP_001622314.1 hypothetical protein NEMVEDRAFT_v1g248502 [Nematostella vectensis]